MPELEDAIQRYPAELRRENASPHTLRNYGSDLREFAAYFSPPGTMPPTLSLSLTALDLREWLGALYERGLNVVSVRRTLAAVRSLFHFMAREGTVPTNVARLVRTPKAPKRMPVVPTAEQTNGLIDAVALNKFERPHPARDLLLFELLYGCGLRVSESVGLNLDDFDREQWIRVRGKGRKERQVPYGAKAAEALNNYLMARPTKLGENALLISNRGVRLGDRAAREIVKFYARMVAGDGVAPPSQFPPRLRDASARRRSGSASHSGTVGPRAVRHHAEVHAGISD